MIQVNELRVGNWVCGTGDNANFPMPLIVQAITNENVFFSLDNKIKELDYVIYEGFNLLNWEIYPIPLTPEVMERVECKSFNYFMNESAVWVQISGTPHVCTTLHHLQNLIFALTGEEITYKP